MGLVAELGTQAAVQGILPQLPQAKVIAAVMVMVVMPAEVVVEQVRLVALDPVA